MKKQSAVVLSLTLGFALGWVANHHYNGTKNSHVNESPFNSLGKLESSASLFEQKSIDIDQVIQEDIQTDSLELTKQKFKRLLAQHAVEEAMSLYDSIDEASQTGSAWLKKTIYKQLVDYLKHAHNEALMLLIDAYLYRHYDDTEVLLILAEYQREQGYPDEAARVIQLAFTYAYELAQREKISTAFEMLVSKTDNNLMQQQRWVELLGFYDLLASIGLIQPKNLLRKAHIHHLLGDNGSAINLLKDLLDSKQLNQQAQELLGLINAEQSLANNQAADEVRAVTAIPLQRRGNHYLIRVQLNEEADVILMIDTGASITSLSQQAFSRLSSYRRFSRRGFRLFNTASGIARADMYQAEQLTLGEFSLKEVDLAVLDFNADDEVDGLLGMNVLQHFRFEIDQDKSVLNLTPRL